jgi:hypothetical protein
MLIDGINVATGSASTNLVITNVTAVQKAALTNVNAGEIVFQTDGTAGLYVYDGSVWVPTKDALDTSLYYTKSQVDTALTAKEGTANKGVANGYASLDSNAKIPTTLLPDSILGQLEYQGVRDMTVELPTASSANKGYYYVTSTSGNGYVTGDWAVSNGTSWDKVDNTDAVQTVAGRTGAVTLTTADLTDFATAVSTPLTLLAPLASPTFTGTPLAPTATAGTNTTQVATTAFVLANAVTQTTVNTVTGRVQDSDGNLRSVPQLAKTAAYTLLASDNGKNINITTGGITIPVSVFAAGDIVSIYNQSGTAQNVSWSAGTVYLSGTSSSKTSPLSLSARGVLTIMFVTGGATPEIVVSGNV